MAPDINSLSQMKKSAAYKEISNLPLVTQLVIVGVGIQTPWAGKMAPLYGGRWEGRGGVQVSVGRLCC